MSAKFLKKSFGKISSDDSSDLSVQKRLIDVLLKNFPGVLRQTSLSRTTQKVFKKRSALFEPFKSSSTHFSFLSPLPPPQTNSSFGVNCHLRKLSTPLEPAGKVLNVRQKKCSKEN